MTDPQDSVYTVTTKDAYPLLRIYESFNELMGPKWFNALTWMLDTGMLSYIVGHGDKHKKVFENREGLYELKVMPIGLCNIFMETML